MGPRRFPWLIGTHLAMPRVITPALPKWHAVASVTPTPCQRPKGSPKRHYRNSHIKFVCVTVELRNRHGRFAFQTHKSGPMLGTTGCTAMPTSTMAGERTGRQLKSHSPDLHKDCNTTRGVPAGSHNTQAALECSAVDTNKATPSRKTVSTLLFLRSFEGFYGLRPLTLATSPSQHPISSPPRHPGPPPLLAKERLQRLSSRIQQSKNNPGRYQNPSRKEICQDAHATTTTTFLTTP